ncbi:MAG: spore cortex biosynthesis protein YabQ [Oscillospiraceae bacterium]|nr:spore cortex biosynthesis protein YabQ [Oscillospiraceae bacterium]
MELPLGLQGRQFLLAAALGFALGLHYDILRGLRRVVRQMTAVLDFWFALTVLISGLSFSLYAGNGEYRIFMLVGTAVGMAVWFLTLSRLFLACSIRFWRILTVPLRLFGRLFGKILEKMRKNAKKLFATVKKSVTIKDRLRKSPLSKKEGNNDAPIRTHYKAHHTGSHGLRDRDDRCSPAENQRAESRRRSVV